jgi:hypothetical protein
MGGRVGYGYRSLTVAAQPGLRRGGIERADWQVGDLPH